ncbi:MAG: Hachiman antiphage defense system protein HamA [Pirellulaceae bacterium]
MSAPFLRGWMDATQPVSTVARLVVLREKAGARASVEKALDDSVKEHFVGLDILAKIGTYKQALAHIRNKLPANKRVRSGDFGEILATEYASDFTEYRIPIKRLRWKDDRAVAMRGNDVIGIKKHKERWHLLKGESKSRATLSDQAVKDAVDGLHKHTGRPNPSSLAFIASRLHELGRHDEATVFDELQTRTLRLDEIEHMVFTFSGNDPVSCLNKHSDPAKASVRRHLVGCVIEDHQKLIEGVFERLYAGTTSTTRRATK